MMILLTWCLGVYHYLPIVKKIINIIFFKAAIKFAKLVIEQKNLVTEPIKCLRFATFTTESPQRKWGGLRDEHISRQKLINYPFLFFIVTPNTDNIAVHVRLHCFSSLS